MILRKLHPDECIPPHSVSRPDDVIDFANEFYKNGWGMGYPRLVGYPWAGTIQLLSGSHRWAGAKMAGLKEIPVVVLSRRVIERAWGDPDAWRLVMGVGNIQ